ncbi:MAG TPA: ChaN family lipoprotein [Gemmatimonadaceae bacterium]
MARLKLLLLALAAGCTPGWTGTSGPEPAPARTSPPRPDPASIRVYRSATHERVSLDELAAAATRFDVLVFGEQHDDPETHFAEFALLQGIGGRRSGVALSMEMFERDVQPALSSYLRGETSETEFLAQSRPWERYATDYRPMVQLARARGWPVIAANVPRPIASAVSRKGLSAIDTLSATSRAWAAKEFVCAHDGYYDRFAEEMKGHSAGGGPPTAADVAQMAAMTDKFYEAQCVKDETMAESIARLFLNRPESRPFAFHVTGAFHSDYRQGTVQRLVRREPNVRVLVVTAVPVDDPASATMASLDTRADYVIFTKKPSGK